MSYSRVMKTTVKTKTGREIKSFLLNYRHFPFYKPISFNLITKGAIINHDNYDKYIGLLGQQRREFSFESGMKEFLKLERKLNEKNKSNNKSTQNKVNEEEKTSFDRRTRRWCPIQGCRRIRPKDRTRVRAPRTVVYVEIEIVGKRLFG